MSLAAVPNLTRDAWAFGRENSFGAQDGCMNTIGQQCCGGACWFLHRTRIPFSNSPPRLSWRSPRVRSYLRHQAEEKTELHHDIMHTDDSVVSLT
jgi:hypothetical protein